MSNVLVNNGGTLTVKNGTIVGGADDGAADKNGRGGIAVYNYASGRVDLEKVTIKRDDSGNFGNYVVYNGGTMTLKNCTVENDSSASSVVCNGGQKTNGTDDVGTMTITGGSYSATKTICVKNDTGTMTIDGATITSTSSYAIQNWSVLTVNSATVNGAVSSWAWNAQLQETLMTINGGVINGKTSTINYGNQSTYIPKTVITNGIFNGAVNTYTYANSAYTVVDDSAVATVIITGGTFKNTDGTVNTDLNANFIESGYALDESTGKVAKAA